MNYEQKKIFFKTIFYSLVSTSVFIIKFYLIPLIPNIDVSATSSVNVLFNYILIPILIFVGIRKEPLIRYWLFPDFIYCLLSFLQSGKNRPFEIGLYGAFYPTYHWIMALIDRSITFIAIGFLQLLVSLILKKFEH